VSRTREFGLMVMVCYNQTTVTLLLTLGFVTVALKMAFTRRNHPPYMHELNGKAERINQTIQNSTKTLLLWAGLSENYWNFAVKYAGYIYNKIPHQGSNNLIPDEIYTGKGVNLKYLKVFGCICYFKNYSQNKSKFAANAKREIFLGFSNRYYSYIVVEPTENKIKIHYTREIYCLEDEPANYKCDNNKYFDPYFSFFNERI